MPASVRASVHVRVPAKVNLHLSVGDTRPDGYHELVTVFHAVDLVDELTARPAHGLSLAVTGAGAGELPTDEANLAWRAAALLAEKAGVAPNAQLRLHKSIPVAGGMAGGSADAAAALVACAALWQLDLDLYPLAARLGADVAFPLLGGTAVGTGVGEVLRPLPVVTDLHWVLALADGGISAAAAYRRLDLMRAEGSAPAPIGATDSLLGALASGDVDDIAAALGNDLEPAALAERPDLRQTLDAGLAAGALRGIVSGSGPTCAFLCRDLAAADLVAQRLRAARVCRDVVLAMGPAPGARVVD